MDVTYTITVLEECLKTEKEMWKIASKDYHMLTPMKGMEQQFMRQSNKCHALMDLIRAMKSETVKVALAAWQIDVMQNGPSALDITGRN